MNIIRSVIVDPASDAFWEDISTHITIAETRPLLVLAATYASDGKEEMQLKKMLDASGLKQDQYHIIQLTDTQKISWHQLREQLDPRVVFLIGVAPAQLGISAMFQLNVPNNFNDRFWLPTLSLGELEQNADLKKQLWVSGMKPLFVDKTHGDILAK